MVLFSVGDLGSSRNCGGYFSNSLMIACTIRPRSEWTVYWNYRIRWSYNKTFYSLVITFEIPGETTSPFLELTQEWLTIGLMSNFGFSFGKPAPRIIFITICRSPDKKLMEYSSFSLITWTLEENFLMINQIKWGQICCTYLWLNTFNVSICFLLISVSFL